MGYVFFSWIVEKPALTSFPMKSFHPNLGDEIDVLNDSWMFLLWVSDTSPVRSHSPSSRWPIAILPASLYVFREGINITLAAITQAICASFNKLSGGIKVHDLQSLGGGLVPLL